MVILAQSNMHNINTTSNQSLRYGRDQSQEPSYRSKTNQSITLRRRQQMASSTMRTKMPYDTALKVRHNERKISPNVKAIK